MKLLLVEDSHLLQRSLSAGLTNSGMAVDQAFDGQQAESYLLSNSYDVVILDIMLPKINGLEVLKRLRQRGDRSFVLILSAKDEVNDRTRGLDLGADDYLIKPFSFDELISRLHALKRRIVTVAASIESTLIVGTLEIDTNNRVATVDQISVELTPSEYRVLELLVLRRGQTFSTDQLIERIYRSDKCVTRNAIEAHVSSLRRKLREAGAKNIVKTRRGFGYYIEPVSYTHLTLPTIPLV